MNTSDENSTDLPEDAALDGLLSEVFDQATPPDLRDTILHRLRTEKVTSVMPPPVSQTLPGKAGSNRAAAWSMGVGIVAALAASLLFAFMGWQRFSAPSNGNAVAGGDLNDQIASVTAPASNSQVRPAHPAGSARPSESNRAGDSSPAQNSRDHERSLAADTGDDLFANEFDSEPASSSTDEAESERGSRSPRSLAGSGPSRETESESSRMGHSPNGPASDGALSPDASATLSLASLQFPQPRSFALNVVDDRVESRFAEYWQAVGVAPAPSREVKDKQQFLRAKLGFELSADQVGNPSALQTAFQSPRNSRRLAQRFLMRLTDRSFTAESGSSFRPLVDSVARAFRGEQNLGSTLASWTSADHKQSKIFFDAMRTGGRHGLVQRFASVTMNRDVQCLRCHDALIQSQGLQRNYWAFAGVLQHADSKLVGPKTTPSPKTIFFDALDGRRVMTNTGVPLSWAVPDDVQPRDVEGFEFAKTDLKTWTDALPRSPGLARGVVNVLWKMVHDRPLQGSITDVDSAPHDATLDSIERALADDLLAHDFDVSRTLALIVASPVTDRSVPRSLSIENRWAVDSDDEQAHAAFAASKPTFPRWSIAQRMELILSTSGATLQPGARGSVILAQPVPRTASSQRPQGSPARKENSDSRREIETRDFPILGGSGTDQNEYPVQWLRSIDTERSRLEHLCYLSGRTGVPKSVVEANEAMTQGQIEEPLRLRRLWWMIRP